MKKLLPIILTLLLVCIAAPYASAANVVASPQNLSVDGVDAAAQILKSFRGRCGGPVGGGVVGCFGHGYISRMFS